MSTPERCHIDADGWLQGPINITHRLCPNHSWGMAIPSGVQGVVMHTMVGDLNGANSVFMNASYQASAHFGIAQDGEVIQWVPCNGGVAWAEVQGNYHWYSIEHADAGNPHNPLTAAQILASAQIVEALATHGNFPLQVTDSINGEGYGVHNMGAAGWGGHSCPDYPYAGAPFARSTQRHAIIEIARAIRNGGPVPAPSPVNPPDVNPVLSSGDSGHAVRHLQKLLNAHGADPQLSVDGDFGPSTLKAVKAYQELHRLAVDGVIGAQTWKSLEAPQPIDPGEKIKDHFYRHTGNDHVTFKHYAASRGITVDAITCLTRSADAPITKANLDRFNAFLNVKNFETKAIPSSVVFYTSNP